MTLRYPSRKIRFDHSTPKTLLEVKQALRLLDTKASDIHDLVSAINTLARTEKPLRPNETTDEILARILVDARWLTKRFHKRWGAKLGFDVKSWRNITSRIRKALRWTAAWRDHYARKLPMSPEWLALFEKTPPWSRLSFLGAWATQNNVQAHELNDDHSAQFEAWLHTWKARDSARMTYVTAIKSWNTAAGSVPDWPGKPVAIAPNPRRHYSVLLSEWPDCLKSELDQLLLLWSAPDIDAEHQRKPVAAETLHGVRKILLRTASAYVRGAKIEPSRMTSFLALLEPKCARIAFDFMLSWAQLKDPAIRQTTDIHRCAKLLADFAGRLHPDHVSAENLLQLQKMARNRCPPRVGMAKKNRDVLKLVDDDVFLGRFLELPFKVAARLVKLPVIRGVDAHKGMLAFATAQQIEAPLRPGNQEHLRMHEQIIRFQRGGKDFLGIKIDGEHVKNNEDLDFELSGPVVGLYDTWVTVWRPRLIDDADNPFLYPGRGRAAKSPRSLSRQIAEFVQDELGERITAHQFRHIIGYLYLLDHPGDYEVVRQMLGHKDIITTMRYYAALERREASKRIGAFIAEKRAELRGRAQRRRRPK